MTKCQCGHPQERHAFGVAHCTVNTKAEHGVGWRSCTCAAFRAEPKPEVDYDLGTTKEPAA